jgi:hypothetical protein
MEEVTIGLPSDLAERLLAEDLVTEPLVWRGTDVVALLSMTAEMMSAVTAVVVARESIGAVIRRFVHHSGRASGNVPKVTVSIQAPTGTRVLVEANSADGLTQLEVSIHAVVDEAIERADAGREDG